MLRTGRQRAILLLTLGICCGCAQPPWFTTGLTFGPRVQLHPVAQITFAPINESSGLAKSRQWPGVFWTHNDSGDSPRIFAINATGEVIHPPNIPLEQYRGIEIQGAVNVDWEDITTDDQGNLIIGACGNNANTRLDLSIYVVPEPSPRVAVTARTTQTIPFAFPDQTFTPGEDQNFDCEAVFFAHGKIYLLTKHRSNLHTKLYRFDQTETQKRNRPTLIGEFNIGGMVTAAEASTDGRQLAVLTYNAVWLFDAGSSRDDYFGGTIHRLPISAKQCEAICFDGDSLLLTNEQRDLFRIPIAELRSVRD